jgi:hypothetical protein
MDGMDTSFDTTVLISVFMMHYCAECRNPKTLEPDELENN